MTDLEARLDRADKLAAARRVIAYYAGDRAVAFIRGEFREYDVDGKYVPFGEQAREWMKADPCA